VILLELGQASSEPGHRRKQLRSVSPLSIWNLAVNISSTPPRIVGCVRSASNLSPFCVSIPSTEPFVRTNGFTEETCTPDSHHGGKELGKIPHTSIASFEEVTRRSRWHGLGREPIASRSPSKPSELKRRHGCTQNAVMKGKLLTASANVEKSRKHGLFLCSDYATVSTLILANKSREGKSSGI
jgi:hypothetical protein